MSAYPKTPCRFCGSRRVKVITKTMRRPDWRDSVPAAYVTCLDCRSRGSLKTGDPKTVVDEAIAAWDGNQRKEPETLTLEG